ncbi:hypothetical protein FIV41_08990 [Pseudomonas marginalis]|uniref:Uncharacterized protein n=1 Tax=Pseudomonas marginalis TaxID=298 RepID=A0A9X9BUK2_PSEMA|nr:hypothetical protein FIV41_08990 [Pseudomonas marginalis]SEB36475.1 hypothetical protein SAMN04490193_0687 [Pseudomonas marginalis]
MSLPKPCQQLSRDLREAAALLKWASIDLLRIAETLLTQGDETGANEIMTMALNYHDMEVKLLSYSDEVGDGKISRAEKQ